MEKVYSIDGVEYEDLDSIMDTINCDGDLKVGDEVEVKEATAVKAEHYSFVNGYNWIENFQERAYDEHGEWADSYLDDLNREKVEELEAPVVNWFNDNADAPTFYKVTDVKKVEVEVY